MRHSSTVMVWSSNRGCVGVGGVLFVLLLVLVLLLVPIGARVRARARARARRDPAASYAGDGDRGRRRNSPGVTPIRRRKAFPNELSDSYPTAAVIAPTVAWLPRSMEAARSIRQRVR